MTLPLIVMVLISPVTAAEDVLYANGFEDGLGNWAMSDPAAWELIEEDGNTALWLARPSDYRPPFRSPRNIALIEGLEVDSFVFEADLKQTGREYSHRDLCIIFGRQDPAHFYYVHLASVADDHANSIFIVDGAPRTSIADVRSEGTAWGDTWHHVKVIRDAAPGLIEVYFDNMDVPVMTANDKTFTSGQVGIGSFDDVGLFDNIVIRPLRQR